MAINLQLLNNFVVLQAFHQTQTAMTNRTDRSLLLTQGDQKVTVQQEKNKMVVF
jgi:hypothetical protein